MTDLTRFEDIELLMALMKKNKIYRDAHRKTEWLVPTAEIIVEIGHDDTAMIIMPESSYNRLVELTEEKAKDCEGI